MLPTFNLSCISLPSLTTVTWGGKSAEQSIQTNRRTVMFFLNSAVAATRRRAQAAITNASLPSSKPSILVTSRDALTRRPSKLKQRGAKERTMSDEKTNERTIYELKSVCKQ
jgi:hypothetical protein